MTHSELRTTDKLKAGDEVYHAFTDQPVVVKEIRPITYENDRYDVFFDDAPTVCNKHGAALWRVV